MSEAIPEVPDLFRLAFMPGVFRCTECDFQLSKQSMNASSGVIGVSQEDRETEECPNDGTMMVPVTYREQLAAYESRLFQELDAADGQRKEIAKLKYDHAAALRERDERIAALEMHRINATLAEKKDCERALVALAGAGICTPEETYGTNSSWAIADLCRAVAALRQQVERLSAPVTDAEWDEMQVKIRRDYPLSAIVDALIAARKGAA